MEKIIFKVEKNRDGYWGHYIEAGGVVGAYGNTITELKADIVTAYNLFQQDGKITAEQVAFQFETD